jgi:DNA processing protein
MLIHWIWLSTCPGLSDRDRVLLLADHQDPEDIYYMDEAAIRQIPLLSDTGKVSLCNKDLHPAGAILRECMDLGIHICTYHDGAYPSALRNIADPPLVLYYKGLLPDLDGTAVIGMVGTRHCTGYGINVAKRIGGQIARCGGIVVSGMAAGIDAAAMSGALSAGGITVGVLGCGVDVVYPVINRNLFHDVERYGCLISEFPPGTPPMKWNFPKRNRIMSGLSNGVLVIEAPYKSGALITARQAAEQGRDVFVVPGNVDSPECEGSNALLREGAIAVAKGWDVMSEYVHLYPDKIRREDGTIRPAGFTDEVMAGAEVKDQKPLKVAQKAATLEKKAPVDKKTEKLPVDRDENQGYSVIREMPEDLSEEEQTVVMALMDGEMQLDDLIDRCALGAGSVTSALTLLEIQGIVVKKPGNRVALK